jgi:hypothetical protein
VDACRMATPDLVDQRKLIEFAAKAAETFVSAYYSASDSPHRVQVSYEESWDGYLCSSKLISSVVFLHSAHTNTLPSRVNHRMEWTPYKRIDEFS